MDFDGTAFTGEDSVVTPRGLYNFRVMPFGLTNAPAVFQLLMQQVLARLNPEDGNVFVTAYMDDILAFFPEHLQRVMDRLREVKLKLNPLKCKFVREEVKYLDIYLPPNV